jgi:sec-independent protein translocase protein TatA
LLPADGLLPKVSSACDVVPPAGAENHILAWLLAQRTRAAYCENIVMIASVVFPGLFGFNTIGLGIVLVIVLLLFGNRLPVLMRSLGRSVVEFKKGIGEVDDEEEEDSKKSIKHS